MPFDLSEVIEDSDLGEDFTIQRNPGFFGQGGWSATTPEIIQAFGPVTVATEEDIAMIPEADRVTEMRMFFSSCPMYVTNAAKNITSDILIWCNEQYRILRVARYGNHGYWCAIAARMAGN